MAYVSQDRKKGFQEKIKVINKKYGMKSTLSVRHHSTIILTIRSGTIDFINDLKENNRKRYDGTTIYEENKNRIKNNRLSMSRHYDVEDTFKGVSCDYLKECFNVLFEGHYDNSDSQVDYFDVAWYIDVNIGADYTTPYKLISESPVIKENPVIEEQQINDEIPGQKVITIQQKNKDSLKKAISKFNKSNKSDQIKIVCDKKTTDRKCYLYELKITFTNRIGSISTFTIVNDKGTYYLPTTTNNIHEQKFIELFNSKNDDDDTLDLPFRDTEKKEVVKTIEKKNLSRIEKLNYIVEKYGITRLERPILARHFKHILHTGEQEKTFSPLWIVCKFNNKSKEYQDLLLELKHLYKNSVVPLLKDSFIYEKLFSGGIVNCYTCFNSGELYTIFPCYDRDFFDTVNKFLAFSYKRMKNKIYKKIYKFRSLSNKRLNYEKFLEIVHN